MPILPRVRGLLLRVAGRDPARRDLDGEVAGYFDMLVDEKIAAGLNRDEARRQARLEMGGVEQVKESVRAARPAAWLDTMSRDVRYSVRLLAKTPAFSLTAIVVLALGIGAASAVFSLVSLLLLQPPPGAGRPGTIVTVHVHDPGKAGSYRGFTFGEFELLRDRAAVFAELSAYRLHDVSVSDNGETRRVQGAFVSRSYFEMLDGRVAFGRSFTPDEERPGSGAAVLVLSDAAWRRMGRPAAVLGRTMTVNAHPFTVVGVAPAGFSGLVRLAGPDFWMPLGAAELLSAGATERLMIAGRLKPGMRIESANAALRAFSATFQSARPASEGAQVLSAAASTGLSDGVQPPGNDAQELVVGLVPMMGAALIVLLVASLNVANMQLARGTSRRKELAMRLALGAGRVRILRQLLIEGLTLAMVGGAAGLLAAVWAMRAAVASLGSLIDKTLTLADAPDWRVCLATLGFSAVAAVASGLGPAWALSRVDLVPEMRSQDGAGGRFRRLGTRNLLVAGQIALSLALLAASGLFVRATVVAGMAEPGYSYDRQLLLRLDATSGGHDRVSGRAAFGELLDHVRAIPGVESAAMAAVVAFSNESSNWRVWPAGGPAPAPGEAPRGVQARTNDVGDAYFGTLGLSMLRGREFTVAEARDPIGLDVAVIDQTLAEALFPGEDPLGRLIQTAGVSGRTLRVVGVAPALRNRLTDQRPVPHIYLPIGPNYSAISHIHVRAASGTDPAALGRALRESTRATGTRLAVLWLRTLEEARDASPQAWLISGAANLFGAFGAVTLFMATIGLYGVKSYSVSRRTREIGIRMALGAQAGDVVRMVVGDGAVLLAGSVAIGLALALAAGKAVSSLLVGVASFDPLVLTAASSALGLAVIAACYIPARRATRVPPVTALRCE